MPAVFDPNSAATEDGIFGLPFTPEESEVVLIPVPWEATVSYGTGTAQGPAAILHASRQVDLFDRENGRPYEKGISMLPISAAVRAWSDEARHLALPIIASGGANGSPELAPGLARVNDLGKRLNGWVARQTESWLDKGKLVGIVGGDHSVPLGAIDAVARHHPGVGILHIDAHADLRVAYEGFTFSHASIMENVIREVPGVAKLVQVGIRDLCEDEDELIRAHPQRIATFFDADTKRDVLDGVSWRKLCHRVVAELPNEVYVSFDIDGLDPNLCPHTGTPVPGGLSFSEMCVLLGALVESGRKIVGFDLVEVAPDITGHSEWDANVGARVLYKLIGFAQRSRTGRRTP